MKKGCFNKEDAGNLESNDCKNSHKMGKVTGKLCICETDSCIAEEKSNPKTNEHNEDQIQTPGNGVQENAPQLAMIMTFLLGYLVM